MGVKVTAIKFHVNGFNIKANAPISQMPLEVMKLADSNNAVISQEPIELAKLPSNRNAFISQIVIELIKFKKAGWQVKEC